MTSPADIIRQLLIDLSLVDTSEGWESFVGFFPDTPDEAVCVYDTAGALDGRIMESGEVIEHPGIQIRVRGKSYTAVWSKITAITRGLDAVQKVSVVFSEEEVYTVHNVSRSGAMIPMGIDEIGNRRLHNFAANMTITISQQT